MVTRRRHERALARQERSYQRLVKGVTASNSGARQRLATELSDLKDEVALTIVAAEHPSSAQSDARSVATALREALAARGIDLRLELARLEGSDL